MVNPLPSNSVATDGGAGSVDNNAMRYTQRLRTSDYEQGDEQSASLATQDLQSKTYAMRTQNWQQGICGYCKADFKKKTTWQKFCCENCRITAYELRTGKRVNLKKAKEYA